MSKSMLSPEQQCLAQSKPETMTRTGVCSLSFCIGRHLHTSLHRETDTLSHFTSSSFYTGGNGKPRNLPNGKEIQMNSKAKGVQSRNSVHPAALEDSGTFPCCAKF